MAAMAGMLAVFTGCDDEKEIKVKDLPGAAREFVEQYFPDAILTHLESYVPGGTQIFKIEKMWGGYEIEIQDGRDLIYDAEGNFVREDRG